MTSSAARRKIDTTTTGELIRTLVAECPDPERLLELYYWSTEPELLLLLRKLASLSRDAREQLERSLWPGAAGSSPAQAKNTGRARSLLKATGAKAATAGPPLRRRD
jgi:hypothetical protein